MSKSKRDRDRRGGPRPRPVAVRDALGCPRFFAAQVLALRSGDLDEVRLPGRPGERGLIPSRCPRCKARTWEPLWAVGAILDVRPLCLVEGPAFAVLAHCCRPPRPAGPWEKGAES